MENDLETEKMPPKTAKEHLHELASMGNFVFHGSPTKLAELEPRQPTTTDQLTGETVNDGDPAVCTTDKPDIAIFRSLIGSPVSRLAGLKSHSSSFDLTESGRVEFKTDAGSLKHAKNPNTVGYVHVFPKVGFTKRDDMEWRSPQAVKPVEVVEVKGTDLPDNIEIINI
jgi:hypothetical protein